MKADLITRLSAFFEKNPTLKGQPATQEQIEAAEKRLQVTLHDHYKTFIQHFGGAYAGMAIHAFSNGSSIGKETIIELTERNRKMGIFPELAQCYVIADDGSGNPIAISPKGEVIIFDYDTNAQTKLADNLEIFILDNFEEW